MSSQSTQKQEQLSSVDKIGFIEKYAIQYYMMTLLYIAYGVINHYFEKPIYSFAFILLFPLLGNLMPRDDLRINNAKYHNRNIYHAFPIASCVIANLITITYLIINFPYFSYSGWELFMAIYSLVILITPSIDASHQLIHRPELIFRVLGYINMTIFFFNVYPIEHLYLHHKYVGTEKDPITSKKNISMYFYVFRAYFSAHKFTFNYNKLIFLGCVTLNLAYIGGIYLHALSTLGSADLAWEKTYFFLWLGFGGFIGLESIEYIEHYGLVLREDIDKKTINELSSWNTDQNMLHNWMIFRFQRHSDHHMNAYKYFTTMELTEKMPRLPFTFAEAIHLALISPLWYYAMNPFVDEQLENKKVEASHIKFIKIIRPFITFSLVGFCVFLYYKTAAQATFPL